MDFRRGRELHPGQWYQRLRTVVGFSVKKTELVDGRAFIVSAFDRSGMIDSSYAGRAYAQARSRLAWWRFPEERSQLPLGWERSRPSGGYGYVPSSREAGLSPPIPAPRQGAFVYGEGLMVNLTDLIGTVCEKLPA